MPQILRHFTNIFFVFKTEVFRRPVESERVWLYLVESSISACDWLRRLRCGRVPITSCLVSSRDAGAGARHFEWRDSISSRCRSLCCVWLPRHSPTSTSHEDLLRRSQLSIASPVYSGQTKISDRKLAVAFRDASAGACSASKRRWLDRPCVTLRAAKRRFEPFKARRKNKK